MSNNNALHDAARDGNLTEVQAQVSKFDIDAKGSGGQTALMYAIKSRNTEVVKLLLTCNADVNIPTDSNWNALILAVMMGHAEIVQMLLKVPDINVNLAGNIGRTALTTAVYYGHTEIINDLLKADGINVNHADTDGNTSLHCAAAQSVYQQCDVDIFVALLNHGADVRIKNKQGLTCFDLLKSPKDKLTILTKTELNLSNLEAHNYALWFVIVQCDVSDADLKLLQETMKTGRNFSDDVFIEGMSIICNFHSTGSYYRGTISCIRADGTYDITYDAGVEDSGITADQIRRNFTEAELSAKLLGMVGALVSNHPTLAAAKDADGRAAVDVASKPMRSIMQSEILWHGRYRITDPRPEHISATCLVFKAIDEHTIDSETNQPVKVALKLMRLKDQFQREMSNRDKGFNQDYVMQILQTHPQVDSSTLDSWPHEVLDVEADPTDQLTKTNAEKFYLLVMPLADRNLFVALKQERWAGRNMKEVRHVFVQLVHCVEHMHEKGILHADLKTLNIVRTAGQWKLIDLDAACVIGVDKVGHKSSSAYIPPEAIHIAADTVCVRSVVAVSKGEATYELLTAHPSFDVWSLGCILYQMCSPDVKPLFQGGQDDNLVGVRKGADNLFALAEWSPEMKAEKLADIPDNLARNLLSQMLQKDPLQRPSLSRILAHPFLSGRKVARLVGEGPKYDIFLSYRVDSDLVHAEKLYKLLTASPHKLKVFWDKECLKPGDNWEEGFCEGLVSSRTFVPLLSRDAINHPDITWQNFSKLTAESRCDNVFLEHRLAVELQGLGLIEKIFPVFIGNLDTASSEYSKYHFGSDCHPSLSEVTVMSVEEKLRHHMESQALGTPIVPDRTVKSVVDAITACQGAYIVGPADTTFTNAASSVTEMLTDTPVATGTHVSPAKQRRNKSVVTVVLTGGPCGGKSTSMKDLTMTLKNHGYHVFTCPEIPTILMQNGCVFPGLNGPRHTLLEYETTLIQLQLSMEATFINMATLMSQESSQPSIILCDRGACDVAAYVPSDLWQEILQKLDINHIQLMDRYDMVCHLVTAAHGAESYYTLDNNTTRTESPEEAKMLDLRTQQCWEGHKNRRVFPNRIGETFQDKLQETTAYVLEQCERIKNER